MVLEAEISKQMFRKVFAPQIKSKTDAVDSVKSYNTAQAVDRNNGFLSLSVHPFPHCVIRDFLPEKALLNKVQSAVLSMDYMEKNNDLYKFHQTKALEKSKDSAILSLRNALERMRDWISEVCGLQMGKQIDMFAAKYEYTDTLLCHDDELEGRRFAYIYYLVPEDWSVKDGGTLDLFNTCSETGLPTSIEKSILPARNSLALFEVTPKSFHQVAEILSKSKTRLSVSGWFHGPMVSRSPHAIEPLKEKKTPTDIDEETLYSLINHQYLNPETQAEIQEKFGEDSEIQLTDFINNEFYETLNDDVKSECIIWKSRGPAIKRNYEVAEVDSLSEPLKKCIEFLTSDAVFLILSNLTGLKFHPLAASDSEDEDVGVSTESEGCSTSKKVKLNSPDAEGGSCDEVKARVSVEVRRWSHGTYTLVHDTDMEQGHDHALDAILYFNTQGWDQAQGGYTSYIAKGDDEELLQVEPSDNCLALVYRDADTLRFVKHVNHQIFQKDHPYIYDINLIYYEH